MILLFILNFKNGQILSTENRTSNNLLKIKLLQMYHTGSINFLLSVLLPVESFMSVFHTQTFFKSFFVWISYDIIDIDHRTIIKQLEYSKQEYGKTILYAITCYVFQKRNDAEKQK